MRAREHYEILKIKTNTSEDEYKGFNNTINVWWEEPYHYSFGLSFSPVISTLKEKDPNSTFGRKIQTINAGLELKYFPKILLRNLYLRPGLTYTILRPDNAISNRNGYSAYLGLGYEFKFNRFGLAIEAAYRHSELDTDTQIQTITPSVGFHFYKNL